MTREEDRWRFPSLERFGEQLRGAENAKQHTGEDRPDRWRFGATAAALIVTLALIAAVLNVVTPAGALSPINHAPVAAAKSRSVRFSSAADVSLNGRTILRVTEQGVLDFVTGDYETTLNLGGERIERRRVGNVFYGTQLPSGIQPNQSRWQAIRVTKLDGQLVEPPGGYTLIDPQLVFRVFAESRSPVRVIGHNELGGTPTTHYRVFTSLAAFLTAERSSLAHDPRYESVGATLDVWLDRQGRPRRVDTTFSRPSRFGKARVTTRVDFAGYAIPVEVRPPSKAVFSTGGGSAPPSPLSGDPLRTAERLLLGGP